MISSRLASIGNAHSREKKPAFLPGILPFKWAPVRIFENLPEVLVWSTGRAVVRLSGLSCDMTTVDLASRPGIGRERIVEVLSTVSTGLLLP